METHIVPATRVVMWVFSSSSSLANPKSDILGFKSLSKSTLVALMSLWTILILDSSCRKARPLAIPIQILSLVAQSSSSWLCSAPTYYPKEVSLTRFKSYPCATWSSINHFLIYNSYKEEKKKKHECMMQHSPNKARARLLFSMCSYTSSNWSSSTQNPWSLTRFGCCKQDIIPISFRNSRFPCRDLEESCFTAILVPSGNWPCTLTFIRFSDVE